jgi:hypothetical protein
MQVNNFSEQQRYDEIAVKSAERAGSVSGSDLSEGHAIKVIG